MANEITARPQKDLTTRWFAPLIEHGTTFCAPNFQTELAFLQGQTEIPLTINTTQWDNSWICSPFNHYITYAQEEILAACPNIPGALACRTLQAIGPWMKRRELNRVVIANNWGLSTNPWGSWNAEELPAMIQALVTKWPTHTIVLKSLNEKENKGLLKQVTAAGGKLIPSRQIWWFAPNSPEVKTSRDMKRDLHLLHRGDMEIVPHAQLQPQEIKTAAELYRELYCHKYSRHNIQYTAQWIQHLWETNLIKLTGLRWNGALVGVEGCLALNGIMISPIVGYRTDKDKTLGIYRRLAAIPVETAQGRELPLNLSAGVGKFKALRGGVPVVEYLGIFNRHLPTRQRTPWKVIGGLSERLLLPHMKKHNL